jgi:hypothetical protein
MKIVLFTISRTGSTYFLNGLAECIRYSTGVRPARELEPSPFSTFNQQSSWVVRLFPIHVESLLDYRRVIPDDAVKICLYRNSIEDQVLSKIIMEETGVANIKHGSNTIDHVRYHHSKHLKMINNRINYLDWFRRKVFNEIDFDYVVEYETLTDPNKDFKFLFPDVTLKHDALEIKMNDFEQKKQALGDTYQKFYKDFKQKLDQMQMTETFIA